MYELFFFLSGVLFGMVIMVVLAYYRLWMDERDCKKHDEISDDVPYI